MEPSLAHFGVLQVEPTDRCNLSCTMCAPHHEGWEQVHAIPKGLLDVGLWRRVVDGLVAEDCRFDHLIFQWLGDPSLHPDLEELVAIAQRRLAGRVGYLRIDTNAILLTPARMDRLVEAWSENPATPLLLVFTIDAVTPATYRRVKGQDALARVRRNVRHLVMRRARLPEGACDLNVQVQFVLQAGNAHEVGAFVDYWSAFFACHGRGRGHDEIMIKRLSVGAGGAGQLEADLLYERACREQGVSARRLPHVTIKVWEERPWESTAHEVPAPRQPCPGLWWTPVIRHDGHLMMCCADLQGRLDLGSLASHSFRELWEGPLARERRLAHVRGAFEEVPVCGSCGGINWYRTPPEVVRAWLAREGRLDLWPAYRRRMGLAAA